MDTGEGFTTAARPALLSRPRLRFLGDFGATRRGNLTVAEELIPLLQGAGWECSLGGRGGAPLARTLDMFSQAWRGRADYDVVSIDVFSGRAFWWADFLSRLVRRLGKKVVFVLHGGSLPELANRHPARVRRLLHRADSVVAEGELIRVTKSLFFAQAKLYDPEHNRLCATATATYKRQERQSRLPTG